MTKVKNKILRAMLLAAEIEEIKRIDALPAVEYQPSKEYSDFLEKLFSESKKDDERRTLLKKRKIFLVAALIALLALTITACSVITPIREFIVEVFEKYTLFTSHTDGESEFIDEKYDICHLPNGYKLSSCFEENTFLKRVYKNGEKTISFKQNVYGGSYKIDSEGEPIKEIAINEIKVFFFTKRENEYAVWSVEKYLFTLSYPEELDFSEVEKMIRSVAPIGE